MKEYHSDDYAIFDGELPKIRFGHNKRDFDIDCGCSVHARLTDGDNEILIDRRCGPYQVVLEELIGVEDKDQFPEELDEEVATEIAEKHADGIIEWHIHQTVLDAQNFPVDDEEEAEGLAADIFNVPNIMLMIGMSRRCSMFDDARVALKVELQQAAKAVAGANVVRLPKASRKTKH